MKKELRSVGRSGLVRLRSNRTTSGSPSGSCRVQSYPHLQSSRVTVPRRRKKDRQLRICIGRCSVVVVLRLRKKRRIGAEEEPERTNHFRLFPFDGTSRFGSGSAAESPSILRLPQLNWVGRQQDLLQYLVVRFARFFFFLIFIFPSWGWWRKKKQRPGSVSSTPV